MHQTFPLILRLISEASKRGAPMTKNELTEYADLLMQAAARKCDDLADAQDLVQETLLIALMAIENGKKIAEPEK